MKIALLCLALMVAAGLVWIRAAPSDPARWHVDPVAGEDPGPKGVRVAPGRITSALSPEVLLDAFEEAALAEPRAKRLAGGPGSGMATYVFRSRLFGFPDYLTVRSLPHEGGSTLAVLSRLRFGTSDTGVNAARLDRILEQMGMDVGSGR